MKLKKFRRILIIWFVGLFFWMGIAGLIGTLLLKQSFDVSLSKYADLVPAFEALSRGEDDRLDVDYHKALIMRAGLSDYCIKEDRGIYYENAYYFTGFNGDFDLSGGCWTAIYDNSEGKSSAASSAFAIASLDEIRMDDAADEFLREAYKERRQVRVDKYAVKGYICHPISMSFVDDEGKALKTIELNPIFDSHEFEIEESDVVYVNFKNLEGIYDAVDPDVSESHARAVKYAQKVDLWTNGSVRKDIVLPWKGINVVSTVKDGYVMIESSVVHTEVIMYAFGGGLAALWSVIMCVIAVVVLTSKKYR